MILRVKRAYRSVKISVASANKTNYLVGSSKKTSGGLHK
jgi:hypothetical protein